MRRSEGDVAPAVHRVEIPGEPLLHPRELTSVAEVDRYLLEGDVPAAAVRRFLKCTKFSKGATVFGTSAGSPE